MEYKPEELKKAFELYYALRSTSGELEGPYHPHLKRGLVISAKTALDNFRKGVHSSIVDLFSDELSKIERKIESTSKSGTFSPTRINPGRRRSSILASDHHVDCGYE